LRDFYGTPIPNSGRYDIGAHEFNKDFTSK